MKVKIESLRKFSVDVMLKSGLSKEYAKTAADIMVITDMWGTNTHGTKQLRPLMRCMREGGLNPKAKYEVVKEEAAWALIDGNFSMPMAACKNGMDIAIEKAKKSGISFITIKRSGHCGATGYYATMAAKADMLGIAMSNVDPCIAVPGAKSPVLGTNPIAYAAPAGKEYPIFLDIATSVAAASKVFAARALGKKVPDNWLIDKDGLPTNDPSRYPEEGAMLPMAGHKGYGIALMIEILTGVLSGAFFTLDVNCWVKNFAVPANQGQTLMAIDISKFISIDEYKARMDKMIRQIKDAPKAKGSERIYLPGEMEWDRYYKNQKEGTIDLPVDVETNLKGVAEDVGVDFNILQN